jgi:hypothetical protein
MSGRAWFHTLALTLVTSGAHAETVTFPPFVTGEGDVHVAIPSCVLAGRKMDCTFMILNVRPFSFAGEGNCHVTLLAQRYEFRRVDQKTWVGEYEVAFCRLTTHFRLVQIDGPPKRIALRRTYEYRDRSARCVESERELRESEAKTPTLDLEWTDQGPDKLIPLKIANCKSYTTDPGQFPVRAFSR